ncbi:VCBS repeat-containing protein [Streptomyces sp. NPDC041068]|uniref:FG-GAP repeat domain-containing protein n=1 Tax=Streptomyces sp. NPDC041068 TaxID=3155130 RepID=UPI0033D20F9C
MRPGPGPSPTPSPSPSPGIRRGVLATCAVLLLSSCTGPGDGKGGDGREDARRPAAGKAAEKPREGDLNGDGYDDIAAVTSGRLVVVYGSKRGADPETRTVVRLPGPSGRGGTYPRTLLHRDDLDGDGFTDLVATPADGRQWALWGGARGVTGPRELATGKQRVRDLDTSSVDFGSVGDFDGDGSADVFRLGEPDATAGRVHFGPFGRDGKPAREKELDEQLPKDSLPYRSTSADYDGDGRSELTVWLRWTDPDMEGDGVNYGRGAHHYRGSEDGPRFVRGSGDRTGELYAGTPADVDGDGDDELLSAGYDSYTGKLGVSVNRAPGGSDPRGVSFDRVPGLEPRTGSGLTNRTVGDVDGDGKQDLVFGMPEGNNSHGLVVLLPDIAHAGPGTRLRTVDLESPGVPGANREPNPEDTTYVRHRLSVLGPLLDVDGDGRADVVAGPRDGVKRTGLWVFPGSPSGLDTRATRHVSLDELGFGS